mgnify:CR=1 FL=1
MKKNKLIALILSGLLTASALPGGVFATSVGEASLAGVYTGTARGYKSDISVTITIDDDKKITDIKADGDETPSRWEKAIAILEKIKEANGTDGVDTVSGATVSSKAIIDATDKAIMKAFGGFTGGTGTAEDPYLISSEAGLEYLRSEVESGITFAGKYIALDSDITLSGEWTPIGTFSAPFAGVIDGRNHTIDGMTITNALVEASAGTVYAGFIGYGNPTVSLKNISLTNVSIDITDSAKGIYAAGLIAFMKNDTANGTQSYIDNCSAEGSISVSTQNKITVIGGLAGFTNQGATVTNCHTDVDITVNAGNANATVGGLIAWTSIRLLCVNDYALGDVDVTSTKTNYGNVGGLFVRSTE